MTERTPDSAPPTGRRAVRVGLTFESFLSFITDYSSHISMGGMFIRSKSPVPPGSLCRLDVKLKDGFPLIQGTSEVVWTRERSEGKDRPAGMGVKFRELEEKSRDLIFEIVERRLADGGSLFDLDSSGRPVSGSVPDLDELLKAAEKRRERATGKVEVPVPDDMIPDGSPLKAKPAAPTAAKKAGPGAGLEDILPAIEDDPGPAPPKPRPPAPSPAATLAKAPPAAARPAGEAPPPATRKPTEPPAVYPRPVEVPLPAAEDDAAGPGDEVPDEEVLVAHYEAEELPEVPGEPPPPRRGRPSAEINLDKLFEFPPNDEPPLPERPAVRPLPRPVSTPAARRRPVLLLVLLLVLAASAAIIWLPGLVTAWLDGGESGMAGVGDESPYEQQKPRVVARERPEAIPGGQGEGTEGEEPDGAVAAEGSPAAGEPSAQPRAPEPRAPEPRATRPGPAQARTPPPPAPPRATPPAASGRTFTAILDITWRREAGGTRITLVTDGRVPRGSWSQSRLTAGSPREVVRLSGVERAYGRSALDVGTAEVRRIRLGYHPGNEQHIVLDLASASARLERIEAGDSRLDLWVASP